MEITFNDIKVVLAGLRTYGYKRFEGKERIKLSSKDIAVKIKGWCIRYGDQAFMTSFSRQGESLNNSPDLLGAVVPTQGPRLYTSNMQKVEITPDSENLSVPSYNKIVAIAIDLENGSCFSEEIYSTGATIKVVYEKEDGYWYMVSCYDPRLAAKEERVDWYPEGFVSKMADYKELDVDKLDESKVHEIKNALCAYIGSQITNERVSGLDASNRHVYLNGTPNHQWSRMNPTQPHSVPFPGPGNIPFGQPYQGIPGTTNFGQMTTAPVFPTTPAGGHAGGFQRMCEGTALTESFTPTPSKRKKKQ